MIDGGIYGAKQVFVPLLYEICTYAGITEKSALSGAPTPDTAVTFDDFWRQIAMSVSDNDLIDISSGKLIRGDEAFETAVSELFNAGTLLETDEAKFNNLSYPIGYIENDAAQVTLAMGVSQSSEHKQAAYDFIRYCMDDKNLCYLTQYLNNAGSEGFPVNREVLSDFIFDDSFTGRLPDAASDRVVELGVKLTDMVTEISSVRPLYWALYRSFQYNFQKVYFSTDDRSDVGALMEQMYDGIDSDMELFWEQ